MSKKLSYRAPSSIYAALSDMSKREGVSITACMHIVLSAGLQTLSAREASC